MKETSKSYYMELVAKVMQLITHLLMFIGGFAVLIFALLGTLGKRYMSLSEQNDFLYTSVLFILGIVAYQTIVSNWEMFLLKRQPSEKAVRIREYSHNLKSTLEILSKVLEEAGNIIDNIEGEIQNKKELVKQLERQRSVAQQAIRLSGEQVNAVTALFMEQITTKSNEDSRRELRKDILIFILGVLAPILLKWLGFPI